MFVLVLGWALAFPLHQRSLDHRNVERTLADGRVLFDGADLAPGDVLPLHRFHGGWQVPLGEVVVQDAVGSDVVAVPGPLRWPLGRHGRVLSSDGDAIVVDIGSELGLWAGFKLGIHDGRRWLGDVELRAVSEGRSEARALFPVDRDLGGLSASEYSVMTQVIVRREPAWLTAAEVALGLGPALLWLAARLRVGSPFAWLGDRIRPWLAARAWLPGAAEAVALGWGAGVLLPSVACLVAWKASQLAGGPELLWWPVVEPWTRWTGPLAIFGFLAAVASGRRPLDLVNRALDFDRAPVRRIPPNWKAPLHWALHLVVVYAFASTLHVFVQNNTAEMVDLAWPGAPPRGGPAGGLLAQLGWAFTHAPAPQTAEAAFEAMKLAMWTATITGCMVGYGHSVLGPLLGKEIRNVDFTAAGWITNALCYPLLGNAMWRLVAERPGLDPAVSGGFVGGFLLFLGFLTNLAYTWSILNLGTKFGVMTDKGLVTTGWFSVVRHPNYALESMMFLTLEGAGLTTWHQWVGALGWAYLYWLRSEREDAFLAASSPDWPAYVRKVPWKFLPGLW